MDKSLSIALDFDDTYTADPKTFENIIAVLQASGHKVTVVTLRDDQDRHSSMDYLKEEYNVNTVFCAGQSKERIVRELGLQINIWIDDNPRYITNDYPNYAEIFMIKSDL